MVRWHQRRAAASDLRSLDDRILKDIGIDRSGIDAALKGDWDHRRRGQL